MWSFLYWDAHESVFFFGVGSEFRACVDDLFSLCVTTVVVVSLVMVSVNLLAYIYIHFEFTSRCIGDGRETASELL